SGTGSSASCSVTFTPNASGAHTITATYGGDATHDGSSGTTVVTATKHPTTTSVSCTPASVPVGSPTSCTATGTHTTPEVATPPTETVSFTNYAVTLHDALPIFSGTGSSASCSVTFTPNASGAHTITATYGGDATHDGSSGTTVVTATKHPTTTSVSCKLATVPVCSPTSCPPTVTDLVVGATATTPTSRVSF